MSFKFQKDLTNYNHFINNNKTDFIPKTNFRIMTYNVEGFKNYDGVLKVIENSNADVIGLNEALFFSDLLKDRFFNDIKMLQYEIKMCNSYGINVLLSRYPINSSKVIKLEKDPIKNRNRYLLKANICGLDIFLTHLDPFDNTGETRFKQICTISSHILPNSIIIGDFNTTKGSNVINFIETTFQDSFTKVEKEQPLMTTWSQRTIDFIFIGNLFPYKINNSNIYPNNSSDHFPVYIDF